MEQIKVAVIGIGYLGSIHARIYSELDDANLVGIVDIDEAKGLEAAKKFNTSYHRSIDEIIHKVDAVSITVPTSHHLELSLEFIKMGKSLLIEKPIAHDIPSAEKIISEAEKHNSLIQIGHLERFNPAVMYIQDKINEPMFVEFIRIGPFVPRGIDVDVVRELMIHDLDLINFLINKEISSIDAIAMPVLSHYTDIANARIVFSNNCRASLITSRVSNKKDRRIRIFQKNGYYNIDLINQTGQFFYKDIEDNKPSITGEDLAIVKGEPLKLELQSFLDCIRTKTTPKVSAIDGLKALELSNRINDCMFIPES